MAQPWCDLNKVLAVMNFHGFDKDAVVFSNFYHMSKANDCPYTGRRLIDIEGIIKDKVWPCEAFLKFDAGGLDVTLVEDQRQKRKWR